MEVIGDIQGRPVEGPLLPVDIQSSQFPDVNYGPKQWLRKIELLIDNGPPAAAPGTGQPNVPQGVIGQQNPNTTPNVEVTATRLPPDILDLSQMRVRFNITSDDLSSPNAAAIRVYNLSDETANFIQNEFLNVTLNAGYQANCTTIFKGTIKQFRRGRESPVNSYLDILAADGDIPHNYTVLSETFPAGMTAVQQIERICTKYKIPIGYLPVSLDGVNPAGFARGKVAFGMLRSFMTGITNTVKCTWSIQQGQIQVIPVDSYIPGEPVLINSLSGMVGIPEQTDQGIRVRALINPKVRVGGSIKVNQADVNRIIQQNPDAPFKFDQRTAIQYAAKVTSDGLYRVLVVEYTGDTRGQEWYMDIVCLAIKNGKVADAVIPPA